MRQVGKRKFEPVMVLEPMLRANLVDECLIKLSNDLNDVGAYIQVEDMKRIADWLYCAVGEYAEERPE